MHVTVGLYTVIISNMYKVKLFMGMLVYWYADHISVVIRGVITCISFANNMLA